MSHRFLLCVAFALSIVSLAGPSVHAGDATAAAGEPGTVAPITEEECEVFGRKMADLINGGTAAGVVDYFDPYVLAERILQGLDSSEKERRDFTGGFTGGLKESLKREFPKFVEARFLRVQTVDGELRPLVRMLTKEGAMNFYGFVMARRSSGGVKWVDAQVYLSGELLSATTRRLVLPMIAEQNAGFFERLTKGEGAYLKSAARLQEAQAAFRAGKAAEAKRILAGLPPEVCRNKAVLLLRLQVTQGAAEADYLAVLEDWAQAFPGDPSLDLVCIDADFLRKDYAGVVRRLESLGKSVGGDPYLTYMKAAVLLQDGRVEDCRSAAREALAEDPSLAKAYDLLLQIELDAKNHSATAALLDEVEAAYSADMETSIAEDPAYAEFRASDDYRVWKARRNDRHAVKVD